MIDKKFSKDLLSVIISNGLRLLSSILTVFIIPLMFTQKDYGFYKLFLLYISYVGFFHFGFNDGIYLFYAGKDYNELDRYKFRTFTKFLTLSQMIIAIFVVGLSLFISGDRQFIFIIVGINLFILNLTTYFQFISQVTRRFKEFSTINIIYTILNVVLIGTLYLCNVKDYRLFMILTTGINLAILIWYLYIYRDIIFGKRNSIKQEKNSIKIMFKLGIILMMSNLIIMFFSSIPRQFVDYKYPIEIYPEVFSNFSFAYTLMGFTSVFISAISLVIYPTLKKSNKEELVKSYNGLNSIVLVVVYVLIIGFYPISYIVNNYLKEYIPALEIFFVLAPGIAISSVVSVTIHNYYKSLNKNFEFFVIGIINLAILVLSIFLVNKFINGNVIYIAFTTVIVQFIWYLFTEYFLIKSLKIKTYKNLIYIVISSTLFYSMMILDNQLYSFILYGSLIFIFSAIYFKKDIDSLIKNFKFKKKLKSKKND